MTPKLKSAAIAATFIFVALPKAAAQNEAPSITLDSPAGGKAQIGTLVESVSLAATTTDDGLPVSPGSLSFLWEKLSGPGVVTFGDANLEDTTASFDTAGVYQLQLTASDGELTDTVTVLVNAAATSEVGTLVLYEFSHAATLPTPKDATVIASNATATDVTHTGVASDSTANVLRISDTPGTAFGNPVVTDFAEFRLDAAPGYHFDLTSGSTPLLQFEIGRNNGASPLTGRMQVFGASGETATAASTLLYTSNTVSAIDSSLVTMSDTDGIPTVNSNQEYSSLLVRVEWIGGSETSSGILLDNFRFDGALVPFGSVSGPGEISLSATSYEVDEDGGTVSITVQRINGSDGTVSVTYATSAGSATEDVDYTGDSDTLEWTDGDSADKTVVITVDDDAVYEGDESFDFILSAPTGGAGLISPSSATVTILEDETNTAPSIAIVRPSSASGATANVADKLYLDTTVTDDGQPGPLTITWSKVSGPGTVSFGDASAADTWASFDTAGLYVLEIEADDGLLVDSEQVTVDVAASGGGSTGVITLARYTFTHPSGSLPAGWNSDIEGVANMSASNVGIVGASFANNTANLLRFTDTATTSFSISDNYMDFTLTADPGFYFDLTDGGLNSVLRFQIDRISGDSPQEAQMQVFAGTDNTGTLLFTTSIGSSTGSLETLDDGPVSLADSVNQYSSLYFQVQWRGDSSPASSAYSFDTFRVIGALVGSAANLGPVVDAGADDTVASGAPLTLAGSATDDGNPVVPGVVSYQWIKFSGPGNVVFSDDTSPTSDATFDTGGEYQLLLVADDGEVATADVVTITVTGGLGPIESWRLTNFGITTNTGDAANDFDFENDGLVNLIEYAMGKDPKASDGPAATAGVAVDGRLTISFDRDSTATDVTIIVQGSDSLGGWVNLASSVGGAPMSALVAGVTVDEAGAGDIKAVTVGDIDPISTSGPTRFLRILVSNP